MAEAHKCHFDALKMRMRLQKKLSNIIVYFDGALSNSITSHLKEITNNIWMTRKKMPL